MEPCGSTVMLSSPFLAIPYGLLAFPEQWTGAFTGRSIKMLGPQSTHHQPKPITSCDIWGVLPLCIDLHPVNLPSSPSSLSFTILQNGTSAAKFPFSRLLMNVLNSLDFSKGGGGEKFPCCSLCQCLRGSCCAPLSRAWSQIPNLSRNAYILTELHPH